MFFLSFLFWRKHSRMKNYTPKILLIRWPSFVSDILRCIKASYTEPKDSSQDLFPGLYFPNPAKTPGALRKQLREVPASVKQPDPECVFISYLVGPSDVKFPLANSGSRSLAAGGARRAEKRSVRLPRSRAIFVVTCDWVGGREGRRGEGLGGDTITGIGRFVC